MRRGGRGIIKRRKSVYKRIYHIPATSSYKILSDTINNTNEFVNLVKFSTKRDTILGDIKAYIHFKDEGKEEDVAAPALVISVQQDEQFAPSVFKEFWTTTQLS